MSLFPYILLTKGRPEETASLGHGTPLNLDDARPINAEPEERSLQATLSQVNGAGEVEFVRNVPMRVCSGVRLPLKAPPEAPNPGQFHLYGIVAEPRDEADFPAIKECALVAAVWPWSRRWHDYAYFKPPAATDHFPSKLNLMHLQPLLNCRDAIPRYPPATRP